MHLAIYRRWVMDEIMYLILNHYKWDNINYLLFRNSSPKYFSAMFVPKVKSRWEVIKEQTVNLFNMLIKIYIYQNIHKPDNIPTHSGLSVCLCLVLSEKFSKGRSKFYLVKTPQLVTQMSFKIPFHPLSMDCIGLVPVGLTVLGLLGFLEGSNTFSLLLWCYIHLENGGGGTGTCTGQDA